MNNDEITERGLLRMNKKGKTGSFTMLVWFIAIVAVLILGTVFYMAFRTPTEPQTIVNTPSPQPSGTGTSGGSSNACNYQPSVTYTTKDQAGTTIVAGTSYYGAGTGPATTTALTNVVAGNPYTYWVDNGTGANLGYFDAPAIFTPGCGAQTVNAVAYQFNNQTLSGYDLIGKTSAIGQATNVSMGAGKSANIQITYLGSALKTAMPFGGLMVVEYNSTIPTLTASGDGIVANSGKFHITYSSTATSNTFQTFEVTPALDPGASVVNPKYINLAFQNGQTSANGGNVYVKFFPAAYYYGNDGQIRLDVEKTANQATTRTAPTLPTYNFGWGA